jgi:hypothetical protein
MDLSSPVYLLLSAAPTSCYVPSMQTLDFRVCSGKHEVDAGYFGELREERF